MPENENRSIMGIFGGVGPLASSKFVESIYFLHSHKMTVEQSLPRLILYSDPSMPDRTEYLNRGLENVLMKHLIEGLSKLLTCGADNLVICCFTLHYLLRQLPDEILKHVISLPNIALEKAIKVKKRSLLLCTSATNKLKIFENENNWNETSNFIIFPNNTDQEKIHESIYRLKKNSGHREIIALINQLLEKYEVDSWMVGCTEFHLLSNYLLKNPDLETSHKIIDPLLIVAQHINNFYWENRYGQNEFSKSQRAKN